MLIKILSKIVDSMGVVARLPFYVVLVIVLSACSSDSATEQQGQTSPQTEAKLNAATTIYRDKYGTPHVVSDSNYGVYFGYGYAVATDRLFQMEMLRRTVEGRVAEVLGVDYLELDTHVRSTYDHRSVAKQLAALKSEDLEILQAYADGFSHRVNKVLENQQRLLPKEFVDFDFLPIQWTAYDVAMIFIGSIIHRYSDFNSELDSAGLINSLVAQHGKDTASKIYDASKWLLDPSSPTTVPRIKNQQSHKNTVQTPQAVLQINQSSAANAYTQQLVFDETGKFAGMSDTPELNALHRQQIAEVGYTGPQYAPASNFWSVTDRKLSDANGALVNGPQFGFGLPSYVYGIGLHGGDFNVVGNTLLGLPTMLFSHNSHVAWGSTAGMSDQVDVYQERLVKGQPEQYQHNGEIKAFESWNEVIQVRDESSVTIKARRSVHGMVMQMHPEQGIAYARARAWEGAEVQTLMAWINLAKDKTMDAVQQRLSGVAANINFYYMDVDGNLGYTHGGRYPLRVQGHDSRVPALGTGDNDWQGFRPYSDNPTVRNPDQGYIVNWNNRPEEGWIASDLWGQTWSHADRTWHIINELNAKDVLSTDQVWEIAEKVSYDDVSARFLLPYLEDAMNKTANTLTLDSRANSDANSVIGSALTALLKWNGEWRINQSGVYGAEELIVESWTKNLFNAVLLDDIGEEKFSMFSATNNPSNKLGPSMPSSVGVKVILRNLQQLGSDSIAYDFFNDVDPNLVLAQTFIDTIEQLVAQHGTALSSWTLAPAPMVWSPFNFRGVPQASPDAKISLPAYMNRGSENNFFIAKDGAFTAFDVIPPGQSGFVAPDGSASANANDQMNLYAEYQLKTIPFTFEQIKAVSVSAESIDSGILNMRKTPSSANSVGKVSATVQAALKAVKRFDNLATMIHVDAERALSAANAADNEKNTMGALHGMAIVVKDNIHVAGMPNSAGTPALKDFVPNSNDPSVQRVIDAGGIVLGKANMHELAFGITSNNAAFGAVRNFHDPSKIAGGSSGGTAVAVAAGIVKMGLGTDTGGSTRIPPALNGVVGFRPSAGRYPAGDWSVTPISSTRDTVGPIANNVSNVALLDCVITQCDEQLSPADLNGLRLGVPRAYFYQNLSSDVASVTDAALAKLAAAGVVLVDVEMPGIEAANNAAGFAVALYEFKQEMPQYLKKNLTGVSLVEVANAIASPDVKGTVMSQLGDQAVPETAYREAMDTFRPQLLAIYKKTFESNNIAALVLPTTPLTATPIETSDETVSLNGEQSPTFTTFIRNTDPTSNAGLPSITLPSGKDSNGMPIGLMLDGPANSDRLLLSIAQAIESLFKT